MESKHLMLGDARDRERLLEFLRCVNRVALDHFAIARCAQHPTDHICFEMEHACECRRREIMLVYAGFQSAFAAFRDASRIKTFEAIPLDLADVKPSDITGPTQ